MLLWLKVLLSKLRMVYLQKQGQWIFLAENQAWCLLMRISNSGMVQRQSRSVISPTVSLGDIDFIINPLARKKAHNKRFTYLIKLVENTVVIIKIKC